MSRSGVHVYIDADYGGYHLEYDPSTMQKRIDTTPILIGPNWPALVENVGRLMQAIHDSGQLPLQGGGRHYVIRFLTWKEDPALIELFDLKESRELRQILPKKG
jgi:hypothetical protein